MIVYKIDVIQSLKDKGYNTNRLRKEKILSESTIQYLRNKEYISFKVLDILCMLLDCQPEDIIAYKKNSDY